VDSDHTSTTACGGKASNDRPSSKGENRAGVGRRRLFCQRKAKRNSRSTSRNNLLLTILSWRGYNHLSYLEPAPKQVPTRCTLWVRLGGDHVSSDDSFPGELLRVEWLSLGVGKTIFFPRESSNNLHHLQNESTVLPPLLIFNSKKLGFPRRITVRRFLVLSSRMVGAEESQPQPTGYRLVGL